MKSNNIGTITLTLHINEVETGNSEIPSFLDVRGAVVQSTSLSPEHLARLLDDTANEGIIGFENVSIDAALEQFMEVPHDPRVTILSEHLRTAISPTVGRGAFDTDAALWLAKLDAAA